MDPTDVVGGVVLPGGWQIVATAIAAVGLAVWGVVRYLREIRDDKAGPDIAEHIRVLGAALNDSASLRDIAEVLKAFHQRWLIELELEKLHREALLKALAEIGTEIRNKSQRRTR